MIQLTARIDDGQTERERGRELEAVLALDEGVEDPRRQPDERVRHDPVEHAPGRRGLRRVGRPAHCHRHHAPRLPDPRPGELPRASAGRPGCLSRPDGPLEPLTSPNGGFGAGSGTVPAPRSFSASDPERRPGADMPIQTEERPAPARPQEVVVRVDAPKRRRFSITGALALAGVVLLLVLTIGLARGWLDLGNIFSTSTVDRSAPVILHKLRDVSTYDAASGTFSVTVDREKDVSFLPSFIAGERVIYSAYGTVDASGRPREARHDERAAPGGRHPRRDAPARAPAGRAARREAEPRDEPGPGPRQPHRRDVLGQPDQRACAGAGRGEEDRPAPPRRRSWSSGPSATPRR